MEKQTAVEWLVDELLSGKLLMPTLIEQAKEIEKGQIIDAHDQGYEDGYNDNGISSIDYYNDEFNKE